MAASYGPARTLWGAIASTHPFPVTVVVLTSAVLLTIAHHGAPPLPFLLHATSVVLLTQIPVGTLNDYLDRESDARTQPEKPIPAGLLSPRAALSITIVSLALLELDAATFGIVSLALITLATSAGLSYDLWLKPTPLSFLGYLGGFLLLVTWIWFVAGHLRPAFFLLYPAGAALVIAAHLAQSLPDIEIDREQGKLGLAASLGRRWTVRAIVALYACLAVGAVAVTLLTASYLGLAAIGAGCGLVAAAWRISARPGRSAARDVFRLVAPALALLAVAGLLAMTRLGL